jgi:hypothetical protein
VTDLLALVGAFAATALLSEVFLRSRKLQAALVRVLGVHAIGLIIALVVLLPRHRISGVPILVFWSGAFLAWFGVRSHIESSILLRMVHILRRGPMRADGLIASYVSYYGPGERVEELVRAGLMTRSHDGPGLVLTGKGRLIARVALRLSAETHPTS